MKPDIRKKNYNSNPKKHKVLHLLIAIDYG
jgi:hypothetical protein